MKVGKSCSSPPERWIRTALNSTTRINAAIPRSFTQRGAFAALSHEGMRGLNRRSRAVRAAYESCTRSSLGSYRSSCCCKEPQKSIWAIRSQGRHSCAALALFVESGWIWILTESRVGRIVSTSFAWARRLLFDVALQILVGYVQFAVPQVIADCELVVSHFGQHRPHRVAKRVPTDAGNARFAPNYRT